MSVNDHLTTGSELGALIRMISSKGKAHTRLPGSPRGQYDPLSSKLKSPWVPWHHDALREWPSSRGGGGGGGAGAAGGGGVVTHNFRNHCPNIEHLQ